MVVYVPYPPRRDSYPLIRSPVRNSGSGPPHVTGIALLRRRNPRAMLRPRPCVLRTISFRFAPLAKRNTELRLLRFYHAANYPLSHA